MGEHPIEGLMKTTMESLKEMVDVNTIVGDPVESSDGAVIIPISRVSLGFASGGAQYSTNSRRKINDDENTNTNLPFGGGSGAGVSVQPVAFIVVGNGQMKLMSVDQGSNILNNLFEFIPKFTENLQNKKNNKSRAQNNNETKEEA